jgi:hypothetical protein
LPVVAILNAFAGRQVAETELARRLSHAAAALGWEAYEAWASPALAERPPGFALALHFFTPKLTRFPTCGCLWNPPSFMESDPRWPRHVLSYDGYLSASPAITRWLEGRLAGIPKRHFVVPFYPACNRTVFRAPDLAAPRLVYAGTNWDGPRFRPLFERLAREPWFDVYGPAEAWSHASSAHRGTLPFDGRSLIQAIARAGAGLCLHRDEHRLSGTPSLRIRHPRRWAWAARPRPRRGAAPRSRRAPAGGPRAPSPPPAAAPRLQRRSSAPSSFSFAKSSSTFRAHCLLLAASLRIVSLSSFSFARSSSTFRAHCLLLAASLRIVSRCSRSRSSARSARSFSAASRRSAPSAQRRSSALSSFSFAKSSSRG